MASSVEEGMANSHENGIKNNEDDDSLSELNLLKEECQKLNECRLLVCGMSN